MRLVLRLLSSLIYLLRLLGRFLRCSSRDVEMFDYTVLYHSIPIIFVDWRFSLPYLFLCYIGYSQNLSSEIVLTAGFGMLFFAMVYRLLAVINE